MINFSFFNAIYGRTSVKDWMGRMLIFLVAPGTVAAMLHTLNQGLDATTFQFGLMAGTGLVMTGSFLVFLLVQFKRGRLQAQDDELSPPYQKADPSEADGLSGAGAPQYPDASSLE